MSTTRYDVAALKSATLVVGALARRLNIMVAAVSVGKTTESFLEFSIYVTCVQSFKTFWLSNEQRTFVGNRWNFPRRLYPLLRFVILPWSQHCKSRTDQIKRNPIVPFVSSTYPTSLFTRFWMVSNISSDVCNANFKRLYFRRTLKSSCRTNRVRSYYSYFSNRSNELMSIANIWRSRTILLKHSLNVFCGSGVRKPYVSVIWR